MLLYVVASSVLFFQFTVYCPLNGVPKIPTASSAQMRRRTNRRATQIAMRYLILFIFLIASLHIRPVPSSRDPATTKSNRVQFTSSVNCIAINGISNRIADVSTMMISLLFCIIINVFISLTLLATVVYIPLFLYSKYGGICTMEYICPLALKPLTRKNHQPDF